MSMFGPSQDDLEIDQLRADLTTTNASLAERTREADDLRDQLGNIRIANNVAAYAFRVLQSIDRGNEGAVISAEQTATEIVKTRYKQQVEAGVINNLIDEKEALVIAELGPEWTAETRAKWDKAYNDDGTYKGVEDRVTADESAKIRDRLKADKAAAVQAHLTSPDVHDAMIASAVEDLRTNGEYARIETEAEVAADKTLAEEAEVLAKAEIDDEIAKGKEATILKYKQQYTDSYEGRNYKEAAERDAKRRLKETADEEVAKEIDDEEWLKLARAKAEREKAKLREEELYETHLADFFKAGVDTITIREGSELKIYLGEVKTAKPDQRYSQYNYDSKPVKTLTCTRLLEVISQGDGTYIVNGDSSEAAKNEFESDSAFAAGTVLRIGRKKTDHDIVELDPYVAEGVALFVDDDTTDDEILTAHGKVANVKLDGLSAVKDINVIKLPDGSKTDGSDKEIE